MYSKMLYLHKDKDEDLIFQKKNIEKVIKHNIGIFFFLKKRVLSNGKQLSFPSNIYRHFVIGFTFDLPTLIAFYINTKNIS